MHYKSLCGDIFFGSAGASWSGRTYFMAMIRKHSRGRGARRVDLRIGRALSISLKQPAVLGILMSRGRCAQMTSDRLLAFFSSSCPSKCLSRSHPNSETALVPKVFKAGRGARLSTWNFASKKELPRFEHRSWLLNGRESWPKSTDLKARSRNPIRRMQIITLRDCHLFTSCRKAFEALTALYLAFKRF